MIVQPGIPDELRWFYEARFGMFVHFGVSSILGRGEWVMYREKIPAREYEKLANEFNPEKFSAADWVGLAVESGARYLNVTSKHHDGFCLFNTKLTHFNSLNTPFGRDLIGELAEECAKRSLPLVLYYSQPDWHHPNFVHNRGAFKDLDEPAEGNDPDWQKYLDFYMGQVEELMIQYGPAGIWFDGSHKTESDWKGREVYELIKRYNPNAIVNDRGRYGDMFTPERSLPEDLTGFLFEACQSVSKQAWGFREGSHHFTTPELIRSLQKIAGAGGNYLLNVGPKPDGTIDEAQRAIVTSIGRWLASHGEAIYATDPVDTGGEPPAGVRLTASDATLYVHLLEWPALDRVVIPAGRLGRVDSVRMVGSEVKTPFARGNDGSLEIRLPGTPPGGLPAVLRVDTDAVVPAKPAVRPSPPVTFPLSTGASPAIGAELLARNGYGTKGKRVHVLDVAGYGGCLAGWNEFGQNASFAVDVEEAGAYRLSLDIAVPRGFDSGAVRVELDDASAAEISLAGSYENEPEDSAGGNLTPPCSRDFAAYSVELDLPAGRHTVTIRPARLHWGYLLGFVGTMRLSLGAQ
jgi:alpha-L-fucosidase